MGYVELITWGTLLVFVLICVAGVAFVLTRPNEDADPDIWEGPDYNGDIDDDE